MFGDINIVIIIELSNSLAFFITLFEYLRNLNKELEELINRTLEKLPERRRCIFKMHRMEGKKYAEIASLLTVSVKTVEAEMTKALKTLRKEVEKYIE